ncbi:Uncharacterised protein [Salmonella enterica subsp. enterica serovar Bovismorbificans]|nr:Uncharacterised protein [Salmonella enterica subsp. enterica serovar Bovismorbificans]
MPQHCGQRNDHPVLLLAELLTLHSPTGHQHGGVMMKYFRQFADFHRRNAANFRRPFRCFGRTVGRAQKIVGEAVITRCAAGKERFILPTVFHQRMGDPQH